MNEVIWNCRAFPGIGNHAAFFTLPKYVNTEPNACVPKTMNKYNGSAYRAWSVTFIPINGIVFATEVVLAIEIKMTGFFQAEKCFLFDLPAADLTFTFSEPFQILVIRPFRFKIIQIIISYLIFLIVRIRRFSTFCSDNQSLYFL